MYQRMRLTVRANRTYLKSYIKPRGEVELPLLAHIVPNRVSIDVGAAKGLFVYFLRKYSKSVIAFEPNPHVFKLLNSINYSNVRFVCAAAASTNGTSVFYVPKDKDGRMHSNVGSLQKNATFSDKEDFDVQTLRIDDVARGADVGFIKIDTEGTELDVIMGSLEVIKSCRPVLFIEIHHKTSEDSKKLFDIIKSFDYVAAQYVDRRLVIMKKIDDIKNRNVMFFPVS
jgi:FkbM family methyltransferase